MSFEYSLPAPGTGMLRAAMSVADITPEENVYLEGYEAHGDLSLSHCPDDFTSDLKARILLLDNGTESLVVINVELIFVTIGEEACAFSDRTLEEIANVAHTKKENILLSNTHTHHAPMHLAACQQKRVIEGVRKAYDALRPVRISVGGGHTIFGVSRGNDYGIDPDRAYDDRISVIRFDEADSGRPIGMIYSVPIHNTLYGHGPGLKKNRHLLNCEFTGYASRSLEARYGTNDMPFVAMHLNGFYGNSGPVYLNRFYAESLDALKQAGADFAEELSDIFENAETVAQGTDFGIRTKLCHTALPTKASHGYEEFFGAYDMMPLHIKIGAFGNCAYVGVNYEPFAILGARIRMEAPYALVLPAANIYGWNGYIPTSQTFEAHERELEVECQDFKTPLCAEADDVFCRSVTRALCDLAGVSPKMRPAAFQSVTMTAGGFAEYAFSLQEPFLTDKIMLSFGQKLRSDCAENFGLTAYSDDGRQVLCCEERCFSSGFFGAFLPERAVVSELKLLVKKRYRSRKSGLMTMHPELTAVRFERSSDSL